jgi:alginate O-acetyltransferase complex protein AlgI
MLFNSFQFIFWFWPVVCIGFYLLCSANNRQGAKVWLLLLSLVFYGWMKAANLLVIVPSILFNWLLSHKIAAEKNARNRKLYLWLALGPNILYLATFKYVNALLGTHWEFPLGLSFFTVTQVMYLVDCYEQLSPANNLLDHSLFVAFFPYVAAGPLTRSRTIVRQFDSAGNRNRAADIARGLFVFSIGLVKKVIFADSFRRLADAGFLQPTNLSTLEAWIISVAFTLELYFDFSGYSDMAIGVALSLGFEIPENFNSPFRSRSIIEFWQRWHMTLSNFITTYLYTPIVRSFKKVTLAKASVATIIAMLIAGVWHGAGWNFAIYGALHGFALAANHYWKKSKLRMPTLLAWAATFVFVNITLIFFRAPDVGSALSIVRRLIPDPNLLSITAIRAKVRGIELEVMLIPLIAGTILAFWGKNSGELRKTFAPTVRSSFAVASLILVALLFLNSNIAQEFVYFAF